MIANKTLQQEIGEHKQTEIALQESQSTLTSFYNSSPMMMGIIELIEEENFIHIYDNLTTTAFFSLTPEAVQVKKASELDVFVTIR